MHFSIPEGKTGYPFYYELPEDFAKAFKTPESALRPRIRWWIPSPYMSKKGIEKDIAAMAAAGFGGAEVAIMPRFDTPGSFAVEWDTPWWNEISRHILKTAAQYDFTVDFTMTPMWPLALPDIIPGDPPDQGVQMECDGAYADGITVSNPYRGRVPLSATAVEDAARIGARPRLAALTCAKYLNKEEKILSYASARSLPVNSLPLCDPEDPLSFCIDFMPEEPGEYVLFAWWEHPSGNKTCDLIGKKDGNRTLWQADHFGKAAARRLTQYWEEVLLPYYGEDFGQTVAMFIDSLEFQTHLDWTPGFLKLFKEKNGYDLAPYLPAVYDPDSPGCFMDFPRPPFRFDLHSQEIINDYGEFLTWLYIENHLKPLCAFCEKHNISMRYQTAYGKILELAQTALHVHIPETETLYGGDILDFYRLQSGAVHTAGRKIYSIEASAEMNGRSGGDRNSGNFQQTFHNQLWHIQRAMACGVNQSVFHGYSYEGYYEGEGNENGYLPGIRWPGYSTMGYNEFSNTWGPCQPSWTHMPSLTDFIARCQLVLRQGVPRIDLAVFHHSYTEPIDFRQAKKLYDDQGQLEQLGYSYDFIGPATLALPSAAVRDGRLYPEGPAYGALLLNEQERLPYDTAQKLLSLAQSGLPVIIIGQPPSAPAFHHDPDIAPLIRQLLILPTVHRVSGIQEVPSLLRALGITPRAAYKAPAPILCHCRQTAAADFFYFYNYGGADGYRQAQDMPPAKAEVRLEGRGIPVLLDPCSGDIQPAAAYQSDGHSVTLTLELGPNDSRIVALVMEPDAWGIPTPGVHFNDTGLSGDYSRKGTLRLRSFSGGMTDIALSDGRKLQLELPQPESRVHLTNWELELEQWSENPVPTESTKSLHRFHLNQGSIAWRKLPGMTYAAGIGRYTAVFDLEKGWEDRVGYILDLSKVCDSCALSVNGQPVPVNQMDPRPDIGTYLHKGENRLEITVASTLLNSVLDYANRHGLIDGRPLQDYGLLGNPVLIPYVWKEIDD